MIHLQMSLGISEAEGVIDVLLDVGGESNITPLLPLSPLGVRELGDTTTSGSLHHLTGNDDAGVTNALNAGVDETLVNLLSSQGTGQSSGRGVDHLVSDARGLGQDGTETNTGEHVNVVALVGVVGGVVRLVTELGLDGAERRARGEEDSALGPLNGLLKCTLSLGEGVAEGEEDGAAAKTTSLNGGLEGADNVLGEDTEGGSQTNKSAGLDVLNDVLKSAVLLAVVVGTGKVLLVLSKTVTTVLGDKTLGVDKPELVTGSLLTQATASVVLDELLSNTNTGGTGTHEDQALLLQGNARLLNGTNVTALLLVLMSSEIGSRRLLHTQPGQRHQFPGYRRSIGLLVIIFFSFWFSIPLTKQRYWSRYRSR